MLLLGSYTINISGRFPPTFECEKIGLKICMNSIESFRAGNIFFTFELFLLQDHVYFMRRYFDKGCFLPYLHDYFGST